MHIAELGCFAAVHILDRVLWSKRAGSQKLFHPLRRYFQIEIVPGPAQHSLAKSASMNEIEVLFAQQAVRNCIELLACILRQVRRTHLLDIRFGNELQSVSSRLVYEIQEIHWFIDFREQVKNHQGFRLEI